MVRIKICGVTSLADAVCAVEVGADAIGFNFYELSPRYIAPSAVRGISRELPDEVWRVGVFVDKAREEVESVVERAGITVLQFHGSETADFCRSWSKPIIKAVRVRDRSDLIAAMQYPVDFILADTYVEGEPGGTGTRFDWTLLDVCDRSRLILAGGLNPDNVADAIRRVRPFGVDVSSGVERSPGVKDPERVREFVIHAKTA